MPVDWRDNLLEGRIGGAPIFVSEVDTSAGRRTVVTELPRRDKPVNEDMGRAARRYQVTAFVIGNEYMAARDAVLDVLELPGPHVFVHPFQGPKSVVLESPASVVESDTEGGWARFSMTLVESGEPDGLQVLVSTPVALLDAAIEAEAAGALDLAKGLADVDVGDVFNAANGALSKVSGGMAAAKRKMTGALGLSELTTLTDAISDLTTNATRLLNTPSELMSTLSGLVAAMMGIISIFDSDDEAAAPYPGGAKAVRVEAALGVAQDLDEVDTVEPPAFEGAPVDEAAQVAEAAVGKALRVASVTQVAATFATLPLEAADTAKEVLLSLGDKIEALLQDPTTGDELFAALTDTRAALDRHLAGLAATLPSVQEYTPPVTMPALLIAWLLYGEPLRDVEIAGRNDLRDPNFVAGGEPLEVLDA